MRANSLVFCFVSFALLAGCDTSLPRFYRRLDYRTAADISTIAEQPPPLAAFYVTNRAHDERGYLPRHGEGLTYGSCDIHIPRDHNIGNDIVTDAITRVGGRPNPQHLTITRTNRSDSADAFFDQLKNALEDTPRKDLVILVHGYNNSFPDVVQRSAEFVYDLGYKMVPLAFSWVSQGTVQGYLQDEDAALDAGPDLAVFLKQLVARIPEARIHLIAHSMGSRVVTAALAELQVPAADARRPFANVIFAAPDIKASLFTWYLGEKKLTQLGQRTTLYASCFDRPLELSSYLHGKDYPRAGRAAGNVIVLDGLDTIDVSLNDFSPLGHGYYGDNRAVIYDLFMLLVLGAPPANRNLYHADTPAGRYWLVRP